MRLYGALEQLIKKTKLLRIKKKDSETLKIRFFQISSIKHVHQVKYSLNIMGYFLEFRKNLEYHTGRKLHK